MKWSMSQILHLGPISLALFATFTWVLKYISESVSLFSLILRLSIGVAVTVSTFALPGNKRWEQKAKHALTWWEPSYVLRANPWQIPGKSLASGESQVFLKSIKGAMWMMVWPLISSLAVRGWQTSRAGPQLHTVERRILEQMRAGGLTLSCKYCIVSMHNENMRQRYRSDWWY